MWAVSTSQHSQYNQTTDLLPAAISARNWVNTIANDTNQGFVPFRLKIYILIVSLSDKNNFFSKLVCWSQSGTDPRKQQWRQTWR